ncbi:amidase [Arthrobacter crystallopoietes]|uniref:amidase n=1 Tax=Crystallibacter crystallopoietes TaxID=37928 RepID=UPI001ABE9B8C|nr:amidase [Arthrobacter crystallopoietes]QTG82089.1 amidase [Arthrobacter crystallopoietes]
MDPFSSAVSLAAQIRTRQVSPVEVADLYLNRIEALNPTLNAIVWRNDEDVRLAAKRAEQAVMDGGDLPPFHGVPLPIKDLTSVAGQPNTHSSLAMSDAHQTESDLSAEKLTAGGFLFMGRTNSPELGPLTVTENARHGATCNPWDVRRTPGGSSGGAAAAVAAGLAPAAHASDGGGSIRVPSSACGLVGLKPSRGRVPQRVFGWEHSTTEGAIVRHVEDAASILDVMAGPDPLAWYSAPAPERPFSREVGADAGRLRVGLLLTAPTGVPVDAECAAAATRLAGILEGMGHDVYPVTPTLFSREAIDGFQMIIGASLAAIDYDDPSRVDPYIAHRLATAAGRSAGDYARASALLQLESREIIEQWGRDFDVLVTPTMACETPLVGSVYNEANNDPAGPRQTELQMISFTSFCNITGLPAISLPVHTSASGLPVGAQIVAGPYQEATLIRLGSAVERHVGWTGAIAPAYA